MDDKLSGVAVAGTKVKEVQAAIERAEELGIQAVWMTTGGARLDSITTFAAAAERTHSIKFGTSIVPSYPRHPLVMVQQAQVIAQLAPGRFRLGIGPSHRPTMRTMGIQLDHPLGHLKEYLRILKALLQDGKADFDGTYYQAHDSVAEADGAISWVTPAPYLKDVALPAMKTGAEKAGRPVPPLIAHVPVCVHDNVDEVRAAYREQFAIYPQLPFYRRMLVASGYPEAAEGAWSDAMIDGLVIYGDEDATTRRLQELLSMGATEVLASPVLAGSDRAASMERTLRLLGQVARSVAKST